MSGMGDGFNFNQMLDPLGTILGISPTAKMFGPKEKKASVPTPAPTAPISDEARMQQARRRSTAAQITRQGRNSTILTEADDGLGG